MSERCEFSSRREANENEEGRDEEEKKRVKKEPADSQRTRNAFETRLLLTSDPST